MKPSLKILLALLSIGAIVALALFGWSVKAKDDATYRLANGVEVTPIEVKSDDLTRLLDVKVWKFEMYLPHPELAHSLTLNLYHQGKFIKSVAGGGFGPSLHPNHHVTVTIGLAPLGGDFSRARQVKWMTEEDGGEMSSITPNPFQTNKGLSWNTGYPQEDNGLIYLMTGTNSATLNGNAKEDDTSVALEIKPLQTNYQSNH